MTAENAVLAAESAFFSALVEGDAAALDKILADDFRLIDVMRGSEGTKDALVGVMKDHQVVFALIEPADVRVRVYGGAAIETGRTSMRGQVGGAPFSIESRYTHVYVQDRGSWRLVNAQGTPIVPC